MVGNNRVILFSILQKKYRNSNASKAEELSDFPEEKQDGIPLHFKHCIV
jgi:hypothetical protein